MASRLLIAFTASTFVTLVAAGCAAPIDSGEEMGENESFILEGRVLKASEVADHVRSAGFSENLVGKMTCVAKWESSFFEKARNGSHYGIFQIAGLHLGEKGCPKSASALYDPATNAKCAKAVYDMQGIGAWVAYKSHRSECDKYSAPPRGSQDKDDALPSTTGDGTPTKDDDVTTADTNENEGGGCWSKTKQEMVQAMGCVQSRSNSVWYQCKEGAWYRGDDATEGRFGRCTSSDSL